MKNIQYLESKFSKDLIVDKENLRFIKVGVIGFSVQPFNKQKCKAFLTKTLLDIRQFFPLTTIMEVVSGYTDMGVPAIAYRVAQKLPKTLTVGFTAREAVQPANKYKLFPVDKKIIIGNKFGDESREFVRYIDLLVRYGGGKQAEFETTLFSARHKGMDMFIFRGNP